MPAAAAGARVAIPYESPDTSSGRRHDDREPRRVARAQMRNTPLCVAGEGSRARGGARARARQAQGRRGVGRGVLKWAAAVFARRRSSSRCRTTRFCPRKAASRVPRHQKDNGRRRGRSPSKRDRPRRGPRRPIQHCVAGAAARRRAAPPRRADGRRGSASSRSCARRSRGAKTRRRPTTTSCARSSPGAPTATPPPRRTGGVLRRPLVINGSDTRQVSYKTLHVRFAPKTSRRLSRGACAQRRVCPSAFPA